MANSVLYCFMYNVVCNVVCTCRLLFVIAVVLSSTLVIIPRYLILNWYWISYLMLNFVFVFFRRWQRLSWHTKNEKHFQFTNALIQQHLCELWIWPSLGLLYSEDWCTAVITALSKNCISLHIMLLWSHETRRSHRLQDWLSKCSVCVAAYSVYNMD